MISPLLLLKLILIETICCYQIILIYGTLNVSDVLSTTNSDSYESCSNVCLSNINCVSLFYIPSSQSCSIYFIYQVNSYLKNNSLQTIVGIKTNSSSSKTCPSSFSDVNLSGDVNGIAYQFSSSNSSFSYETCPDGYKQFTRTRGIWCMKLYDFQTAPITFDSSFCSQYSAYPTGFDNSDELSYITSEIVSTSMLKMNIGIDGHRIPSCYNSTTTWCDDFESSNNYTSTPPLINWGAWNPSRRNGSVLENELSVWLQNASTLVDIFGDIASDKLVYGFISCYQIILIYGTLNVSDVLSTTNSDSYESCSNVCLSNINCVSLFYIPSSQSCSIYSIYQVNSYHKNDSLETIVGIKTNSSSSTCASSFSEINLSGDVNGIAYQFSSSDSTFSHETCPDGYKQFTRTRGIWCMKLYDFLTSPITIDCSYCSQYSAYPTGFDNSDELSYITSEIVSISLFKKNIGIDGHRSSSCYNSTTTWCDDFESSNNYTSSPPLINWSSNNPSRRDGSVLENELSVWVRDADAVVDIFGDIASDRLVYGFISCYQIILIYGTLNVSDVLSTTNLDSYESCSNVCLSNINCVSLFYIPSSQSCSIYSIYQVNSYHKNDSLQTIVGIKTNTSSSTCPSKFSDINLSGDVNGIAYQFSSSNSSLSYETCPDGYKQFTRTRGIWCMKLIYESEEFPIDYEYCAKNSALLSGFDNAEEVEYITGEIIAISLTGYYFGMDGRRISSCYNSTTTWCDDFEWTNNYTSYPMFINWIPGQPSRYTYVYQENNMTINVKSADSRIYVFNDASYAAWVYGFVCGVPLGNWDFS
ncbi:unnamed protein product [Caenorhabditis angaria]|uniref:Apple domain-containing protein n=1 Tax=Caenorhabditis angaria TaxID=860376 RepID=A0A9P1ITI6_9PELO|nr:unnamed protein product [Caenorhabditis angaria]